MDEVSFYIWKIQNKHQAVYFIIHLLISQVKYEGYWSYFLRKVPAQYDELRMRQHGSLPVLYADDMTSDNTHLSTETQ